MLHQSLHDLLGDRDVLSSERSLQPAVAIAAVVRLKDVGDGLPHLQVLVAHRCTGPMVEVRTARKIQLCKELWQAIVLPEGVNQQWGMRIKTWTVLCRESKTLSPELRSRQSQWYGCFSTAQLARSGSQRNRSLPVSLPVLRGPCKMRK